MFCKSVVDECMTRATHDDHVLIFKKLANNDSDSLQLRGHLGSKRLWKKQMICCIKYRHGRREGSSTKRKIQKK